MKYFAIRRALPLLLAAALLSFAGCSLVAQQEETVPPADNSGVTATTTPLTDSESDWGNWNEEAAVPITLNGDRAIVDGTGATANGGVVTITSAGDYLLTGTLTDGQIRVEATKDDLVRLILNGVDITSADSAGIYSAKANTTVLVLPEGSQNRVTDAMEYSYPDEDADEPDAAIFAKNNLVITGEGTLTVNGNFYNGIGCKDDLLIESGTITVTAVHNGIRGRDSLTVQDGAITVRAGNDGLQSNNPGERQGWILLQGGTFDIVSDQDGVQAESSLTITGGSYSIVTGGGSTVKPTDSDGSYKGLKAGADLTISGGDFTIDSADDALHANNNVTISDGSLLISTGDDGVHADAALLISGGEIDILTSYEGLEGSTVDISGGTIYLVASDDGINAAGGSDSSGEGPMGRDRFAANENNYISISDGFISVTASGDGIDSNGNVFMSGGTLVVNGPTSGGDAALDFDGSFTLTGGVIAATGSSGMAQAPGDDSTQPALQVYFSSTLAGGTPVHLAAADGTPILTWTPEKQYQNIVLTSPDLVEGETYLLYTGGSISGDDSGGLILGGTYAAGEQILQVALGSGTTRISDTGEAVSGFGGMGGGRGGMGSPPPGSGAPSGGEPPGDMPQGERPSGGPNGGRPGNRDTPPELPAP